MKIGIQVRCSTCGNVKAPRGRSVPDAIWDSFCLPPHPGMLGCEGYYEDPKPGDLWPGETEEDFGFACSPNATVESSAPRDSR
jgi:hypothetical protein